MSGMPVSGRGPIIAIGCLVAVSLGILLVWRLQANRMEDNFREAARAGRLDSLPIDLWNKKWTEQDLASVEAIYLDPTYGLQRADLQLLHTRGQSTISAERFSYQVAITDTATGIRHIFGYRRTPPGGWQYVSIHHDSAIQYIQQHVRDHPVPQR